MPTLRLYNYWRSSSSHRVRIGLGLKQLAYEYVAVNLLAKEQHGEAYRAVNPSAKVPALEIREDDGTRLVLVQSLPILEYVEERWPESALLPKPADLRARARALAEIINSGIQPFQNPPTLSKIKHLGGDPTAWATEWILEGLAAYERTAADVAGTFSVGDTPTIADCCLIPQLASARRFGIDYAALALIVRIEAACLALPAFAAAQPDQQPDAVKS